MKKDAKKETKEWKRYRMNAREKLALLLVILIAGAAFIWMATSRFDNFIKAPALILILLGSGMTMAKIGKFENYHGLIILRGERGFNAMRYFSRFPRLMRALADFGLSLGFGMIYSFLIFRNNWKKFLAHLVLVSAIFLAALGANATVQSNIYIAAIGILGGLLMFGIASLVIQAFNIVTVPEAPAGAALIVPGVTIPLWEGLIAIIIAATVHEVAHGVLAMVEKLKVKNSGVILLGILPIGAFVEPDEAALAKLEIQKKRRILIAGTTSNFIVSILFLILLIPLSGYILGFANGVQIANLLEGSPSAGILHENEVIFAVNGMQVKEYSQFASIMKDKKEGEIVKLGTDEGEKSVTLGKNGKLGIVPQNYFPENDFLLGMLLFASVTFWYVFLINLALAIINLVPLFLTDGYRLVYEEARGVFPSENDRLAKRIAVAAGALSVLLLLINFLPNLR